MANEKSNTHEVEDGQVDLNFEEYEETTVDLPSEEKNKEEPEEEVKEEPPKQEAKEQPQTSEDEHDQVSKNVQKRIDRLTKKMREAERREQDAIKYAQGVQKEAQELKNKLQTVDDGYMNEYGNRLEIEQKQVEAELKQAMASNDADAVIEKQRKLAQLAVSAETYNKAQRAQQARQQQVQPQQAQAQPQPQVQPQQAQPAEQPPDPKAEEWASKNDWFGKDEAMTFAAFGIHKGMVENEGFDPQSDDYYDELDSRIRAKFPQEFNNGSGKKPVQNVAGNSRSRSRGRKTQVKLTQSQVAIANKLGVPLEAYAKYVKD
tara:strand:+ start:281 stop:1234 length:954 start_codon:yes stop_codon:yes gene_type:complete